jgi:RNA polymerase sigma factor (sigma-70 family)
MSSAHTTPKPTTVVGDNRWFADDVQPHEATVRGYLRKHFPAIDVDDVLQESYLKLIKAKARGRIASTKAYLFAIVRNTAFTIGRRKRIYSDTPLNELPGLRVLHEGPDAADAANAFLRMELMRQAIGQLPPRCRRVLMLAALRGMSNAEIAVELGLAEQTVRVHLSVGIQKCAGYLRELGERE